MRKILEEYCKQNRQNPNLFQKGLFQLEIISYDLVELFIIVNDIKMYLEKFKNTDKLDSFLYSLSK